MAVRLPERLVFDMSALLSDSLRPAPVLPPEVPYALASSNVAPEVADSVADSYTPVPPREQDGWYVHKPHDDWYYRLHFLPPKFELGNLSGDALRTMYLWNANFTDVNLEAFEILDGQGVSYISDITVPGVILPLKLARYGFTISANGPPVLDATAVWTIDGETYEVSITGRRVTLFPFRPDWRSPFRETYTWRTTLTTSYSGKEQRMSLMTNPRRSFVYNIRERGKAAALFDVLTFGWQGRMYSHPIWSEASKLTAGVSAGSLVLPVNTGNMTIQVGSSVLLMRGPEDYEILQVLLFDANSITLAGETATDWAQGARVWPLVPAAMDDQVNTLRQSPRYLDAALRFVASPVDLPVHVPNIPPEATYLGEELYLRETNWRNGISVPIQSRTTRVDNGLGPIRSRPRATFPLIGRAFSWMNKTQDSAYFLLGFFGRRLGRASPVWMPSGTDDFYVSGHVNIGDSGVPVLRSEYQSLINSHPARRHVLFHMRDGNKYAKEIQSVSNDGANSVLNLTSPLGIAFDPEDVKRVSYLGLYRLGSDEVTFDWHNDEVSEVSVNFILTEPDEL